MEHYTILGCDDNAVSLLFEILSIKHHDKIVVEIVKNIRLNKTRHPYEINNIESREIDAENWEKPTETKYLLGVVNPSAKHKVHEFFASHFSVHDEDYEILIHEQSTVASTAAIDYGVIINPGVVIAPYTIVGKFATVNRGVSLGHHTTIGAFAQINPGVNIAGHCMIGEDVRIGMGTNVFGHVTIGNNSVIGAGSLVTRDIPENVIAFGSPAKVHRDLP
jgi:sugar O-acyltransferase (sialic acid O-acetyltransferase NeuD family)